MPCGQSVIAQFGIDAVVAVAVNKTACDSCDPGIGVNVAQGIQCPLAVVGRKGAAVIALFQKCPVLFSILLKHMALYQLSQCMMRGKSSCRDGSIR